MRFQWQDAAGGGCAPHVCFDCGWSRYCRWVRRAHIRSRATLPWTSRRITMLHYRLLGLMLLSGVLLTATKADLNPAALAYKLPNQLEWKEALPGARMAVLQGDPDKPGLYIVLIKWSPHTMSRPHFHPNDRFITVLSGTWWVGTGS